MRRSCYLFKHKISLFIRHSVFSSYAVQCSPRVTDFIQKNHKTRPHHVCSFRVIAEMLMLLTSFSIPFFFFFQTDCKRHYHSAQLKPTENDDVIVLWAPNYDVCAHVANKSGRPSAEKLTQWEIQRNRKWTIPISHTCELWGWHQRERDRTI